MKEKLIIENFGGLDYAEFELRDINILIGPQASGKSVSVKLMYFFKNFASEILRSLQNGENKKELDLKQKNRFKQYFPIYTWPSSSFSITYKIGKEYISITKRNAKDIILDYSASYKSFIKIGRTIIKEEQKKLNPNSNVFIGKRYKDYLQETIHPLAINTQLFIPAGRGFFSQIQSNTFSFLSQHNAIDPFLVHFGAYYEHYKRFFLNEITSPERDNEFLVYIKDILKGSFIREKEKDFILHNDSRKISVASASSGQQEILPLLIVLKVLNQVVGQQDVTLYIEEPEAHLYPDAQKKVVQLLARISNHDIGKFQIIVTTHSPYIPSSFNNLLEAGEIITENELKAKEVYKVITKEEVLFPKNLIAYSVANGKIKSMMSQETKLIAGEALDEVSDEIAIEFGKLLDIAY